MRSTPKETTALSELAPRCPACGYPTPAEPGGCERCGGEVRTGADGPVVRAGPGFVLTDALQGFTSLFLGALSLFHQRAYIGKLALPILANMVVLTVVLIGFTFGLWEFFDWLLGGDWQGAEFVRSIASWLAGVLSLILAAVTLFFLAPTIIETVMSPFLDPLAAATEKVYGGREMRAIDQGVWRSIVVGLRSSAQILLIQLLILLPCLLLSLFGIGAVIAVIVSAWFNALVWFDIPCARRGYGLRERVLLIKRNWARAIGFGLAFQVGLCIPIFNFVLLTPAAAVATSTLYFYFAKDPRPGSLPGRESLPEST